MKALLDTSMLIAAMLPDHVHHAHALPWLSRAKSGADFHRVWPAGAARIVSPQTLPPP
jgi:predicted nucleic acid-binding protein